MAPVNMFIYCYPSVSVGDWFQDPLQTPKSVDAQVPQSALRIHGCGTQGYQGLTVYNLAHF